MTQINTSTSRSSLLSGSGFFLFILLLAAANLRAPITSVGPILEDIRQTFALSATQAGIFNFIPLILFATVAPLAAWAGNRLGLERLLWISLLLIAMGSVLRLTGSSNALWTGTLILSAGIAAANVLLPPLIKRDFTEHTAKYIGLYAVTMSITASIASGIAVPLAHASRYGWLTSVGIWTIPAIIAVIVWLPQLWRRPAPPQSLTTSAPSASRNPWKTRIGWQVSLMMATQSLAFYTLIDWFTPFAQSQGFSQFEAGWQLFVYQAVAIMTNIGCMLALKKVKDARLTAFLASLAIFIGVTGLLMWQKLATLWLIFAGLGAGASMVLCLSLFNLRASNHRQASLLSGMGQCVGYGLAALGPLSFGWLHDYSQGWNLPLGALLACSILQLCLAPFAAAPHTIDEG